MAKVNAKGRSREAGHVRLYNYMTGSAAWLDLSGNAVKLLVYLATWEKGDNNGELFMSERMAAEGIGVSKRTAGKLFDELEEHGFIAPTLKGHFAAKRGPATQWRLTWIVWPSAKQGPTNEWRSWSPKEKSRAQLLHDTGAKIAPIASVHRTTEAEIAPVRANAANLMGAINSPHSIAIGDGQSQPLKLSELYPQKPAGHRLQGTLTIRERAQCQQDPEAFWAARAANG